MKTNDKNSVGYSKSIPNNLDSGTPIQETIRKVVKRWKSQFIVSGAVVVLAILTFLEHRLDLPHLLTGTPPSPFNWTQITFDLVTLFLVGFASVLMLSSAQSKHKSAEEALKESEEKYKALIEAAGRAGEGIIIIQDSGEGEAVFVFVNDQFCRMSDHSREELIGRSPWDLVPPEISTRLKDWYKRRHMGESLPTHYEAAGVRKDGTVVPLELSIVTMPWQGEIATVLYLRDITERKQAEETLRESEERFRQLAENIDQVFWLTDWENNKLLYVNASYEKLFDRSCQSAYEDRLSWYQVMHPDDRARVRESLVKNAKLGQSTEVEYRIVRDDGTMRWILDRNYAIHDKHGKVYRIVSIAEDITERKRAEEALRESEERFRRIIENAPFGYYRVGKDGLWQYVNPVWERMHGFSLEEVIGKPFEITQTEDAVEQARELVKRALAGETITGEFSRLRKNGNIEYHDFNIRPVKRGNEIVAIEGFINDITERKKTEETLKKERQRLFSVLDIMPTFVYLQAPDHSVRFTNRKFRELFGDPGSRPCYEAFYGRKEPCDPCITLRVLKTRAPQTWEWTSQNGRTYMIYEDIFPGEDDEDLVLEIGTDITERKRADEQIAYQAQLLAIVNDAVVASDAQYRLTAWNAAAESMYGWKAEEVLGRFGLDITRTEFSDVGKAEMLRAIAERGSWRGEATQARKDGTRFPVEVSSVVLRDTTGKVTGFVSVNRDITERKRSEEALRQSEENFKALAENANDGILIGTGEEGWHVYANRRAVEITGYPIQELLKTRIRDLVLPNELPKLTERYKKRLAGLEVPKPYETTLVNKDGIKVPIEISPSKTTWQNQLADIVILRDITERKRAEEEIHKLNQYLESIIDNANIWLDVLDEKAQVVIWNKAAEQISGFSREEVAGHGKIWEWLYPEEEYRNQITTKAAAIIEKGEMVEDFETIIRCKNGEIKIISWHSRDLLGADGKSIGSIALGRDITERKRAEEALKESENRYRNLIESVLDIIYTFSPDGIITSLNPAFETITGWEIKDWIGKSFTDLIHPEELSPVMKLIQESIAGKEYPRNEFRLLKKTGDYVPLDFNANPLLKDGKLIGFVGIARDITERKRAEDALRESEAKYSSLVEQATDGVVIVQDKTFTFANRTMAEISGYGVEEIVGMPFLEMVAPESRDIIDQRYELRMSGEKVPPTYEAKIRCKDGTIKDVELSPAFIHYHGKPADMGVVRDITEKKKMEAQLIQSERLAAVGTLAYGIAHEFNNILAGILGNAEFGMGNDDPQKMKECFRIIMESCDRAKSITSSLLAFSRQREIKKQRADVTSAVETILGLVERELGKQNIKVVRKFNLVPEIVCDLGELSGVILNMITNARDAMRPKGGTLTIEIEKKGDNIEMIFTDSGCGIPDSIKGRIFEPFVTTKGALGQSEIPGTGLGLFLSYGIINKYHGEIEVQSKVGKGSTFTIKIPISQNQAEPVLDEIEEDKSIAVPQNLNILLVDDEKPICTAIKKFFEAKGHSVTTALSGKKGLEIFKKGSFDLVLADIIMPDMDGLELISKLKKINPQVKFIVLTGHIADEKLEKAKKAGADQILMKPFRNEELYQAIGKVLSI